MTEQEKKDARITCAGFVNAIIRSGADPNEWVSLGLHAINVHRYLTRKALGIKGKGAPQFPSKGEETNG